MVTIPPSRWADLDGPVHWVDFGGPADGPLLVCVHGLGGSHVNWAGLAPLLTGRCRVVALDLAGFGHTQGRGRDTSVIGNQRLLDRFLTEVVGTPAVLVGNSMGGLVAVLQAVARPLTVAGTVLVDPALPLHLRSGIDRLVLGTFAGLLVPPLGRRLGTRPRTPQEQAELTLRLCCAHPERVDPAILAAHVRHSTARQWYPEIEQEFVAAARSVVTLLARRIHYAALLRRLPPPVLLLHGERDRLVPIGAARAAARANPHWRFEPGPDLGHVPQIEDPAWVAGHLLDWLGAEGAAAAVAASGRASA
jgi:pimeloyl-ACP methyl ester carboxylesterase